MLFWSTAEVLLPFLNLDSEKDPVAVANGVQGWTALHVVAPAAATAILQKSPPFVELLLERAWSMLARNPGEAERRLVRCAAEAAVAAVSQRDIREAIVKAGLPVVLD